VAFIAIPLSINSVLLWIESKNMLGVNSILSPSQWPLFDFVDIWQNLAYIYKMVSIFMSFIIIISVTNEFDYKTIRQNVIDGFDKKDFWLSKINLVLCLALIATILLVILGLTVGFSLSPVIESKYVLQNIEFVFAYFMSVCHLLLFSLMLSLLIKRAGIVIAILMFWLYILEPTLIGLSSSRLLDWPFVAELLPMQAGWNLIPTPFGKFLLMKTQDFVSLQSFAVAGLWIMFFLSASYALIAKRDL
jgi:hypothetical protein